MASADILIEPATETAGPAATDVPASATAPCGPMARWSRLFHTFRYYRAGQIVQRAGSVVRRRLQAGMLVERYGARIRAVDDLGCAEAFHHITERKLGHRRSDSRLSGRAADLLSGRWTFLGRSLELGVPIDWHSPLLAGAPRLWQFQLQYHEWLLDVAAATPLGDEDKSAACVWGHVEHWMRACAGRTERDAGDAWHPYCISRRIPAWLSLWTWQAPPTEWRSSVVGNLGAQAAFLARRLESDLGGNHLLENARALVLAGAAFRTADGDDWLGLGQRIIDRELREQVLPHGEHFERSPMYHCQMIEVLEDVRDATREIRPVFSSTCAAVVEQMHAFSAAVLHPDGRIPLLGDSCFDEAPTPSAVGNGGGLSAMHHARAVRPACAARQTGDYWTFRSDGDYLLFDAGPVGPDHLPAHAHADLLTIEASFDSQRFVVDSGTFDYEDGALRQYCRSTAAHNVLEIDGENQCDVWSRFRMGRRGWPTRLACGAADGVAWASAAHNAYRQLGVHCVGRGIGCGDDGAWLIADWALGQGLHTLINRLHLHPDVKVTPVSSATLLLERGGVSRRLTAIGDGELSVAQGWYCPRFGVRVANPVVEMRLRTALPAATGWQFAPVQAVSTPQLTISASMMRVSHWGTAGERVHQFPLPPAGR